MEKTDMQWRSRPILRLTARPRPVALEQKSGKTQPAAILRRFFHVLEKLELSRRKPAEPDRRKP
jgi:hypothetical protein